MAHRKYSITFTETTHKLICGLEKYGRNIRDVINAGIVLYDQSDNPTRAMAEMRANANLDEEVEDLKRRLAAAEKARLEKLSVTYLLWPDGMIDTERKKNGVVVEADEVEKLIDDALAEEGRRLKKRLGKRPKSA